MTMGWITISWKSGEMPPIPCKDLVKARWKPLIPVVTLEAYVGGNKPNGNMNDQ